MDGDARERAMHGLGRARIDVWRAIEPCMDGDARERAMHGWGRA
jgi:hypothetical protein